MALGHPTTNTESLARFGIRDLATAGMIAALVAAVLNVLVLLVALVLVDVPDAFVGGPFGPLAAGPVVVNTAVAGAGATVVYGVLDRLVARRDRTFVIVSAIALVASFAMFLAPDIAGAPVVVFAVLAIMHVVAAISICGILLHAAHRFGVSR